MQQPNCKGVNVSDGMPCKRNQKLSTTGFCFQHLKQDPSYNEAEAMPRTPAPFPAFQQQQPQPHKEAEVERQSMSSSNSNNDDVIERGNTKQDLSSAFSAASSSSSGSVVVSAQQKGDLPRCNAIAKSTGQQCCKRVSLAGESLCPRHGGKQIRVASMLPMCSATSKSTRQPCQNHVSGSGHAFCTIHNNQTVLRKSTLVQLMAPPAPKPLPEEYENPNGCWANIQVQCMRYLMETHPKSKCQCSSSVEPCQGIRLVMWAQAMVQLAQQGGSPNASSIFDAKVSDLVKFIPQPGHSNNLFSDLYLAVSMFGTNIFFLPRFYQHIQHEANMEPPFIPALFRPTADQQQPVDRLSGEMMQEDDASASEQINQDIL
jgi:hypothetical protein